LTPTTAFYPLSLHDALPISFDGCWRMSAHGALRRSGAAGASQRRAGDGLAGGKPVHARLGEPDAGIAAAQHLPSGRDAGPALPRSEEHTSELQSLTNLVCRL